MARVNSLSLLILTGSNMSGILIFKTFQNICRCMMQCSIWSRSLLNRCFLRVDVHDCKDPLTMLQSTSWYLKSQDFGISKTQTPTNTNQDLQDKGLRTSSKQQPRRGQQIDTKQNNMLRKITMCHSLLDPLPLPCPRFNGLKSFLSTNSHETISNQGSGTKRFRNTKCSSLQYYAAMHIIILFLFTSWAG